MAEKFSPEEIKKFEKEAGEMMTPKEARQSKEREEEAQEEAREYARNKGERMQENNCNSGDPSRCSVCESADELRIAQKYESAGLLREAFVSYYAARADAYNARARALERGSAYENAKDNYENIARVVDERTAEIEKKANTKGWLPESPY